MRYPQCVPLPPNPFDQETETLNHDAYQWCLHYETEAGTVWKSLMYYRCLGYLLLEAPSSAGQAFIADEIIECAKHPNDVGAELAQFYINHLVNICQFYFPSPCHLL